jgi:hypothetical protein
MAGYLPEMQHLDVRPAIGAFELGQQRGDQDVQQNLLRRVGNTAATQGLDAASREAMAGGDLKTGIGLQNQSIERQAKLYDFLGRAAVAADTPEKWTQLNSTLAKTFGPDSVKGFEDFRSRESAIMLSMNASQQAQLRMQNERLSMDRERLAMEKRRMDGESIPPNFEKGADGVLQPKKGGPADPTYIKQTNEAKEKPRQMSITDITKLSDEGQKFANLGTFSSTFKDTFSGWGNKTVGEAANAVARYTSLGDKDAANWWQGYDRYKNVVRNDLFGSALTKTEQAAFDQADINPGMDPKVIRKNMEIQQQIVTNGLKRKADAMISSGYDPKAIADAYGVDLKDIGVTSEGKRGGASSGAAPKPNAALDEARAAIAKGAPRAAVEKRLRDNGIDPAGL